MGLETFSNTVVVVCEQGIEDGGRDVALFLLAGVIGRLLQREQRGDKSFRPAMAVLGK